MYTDRDLKIDNLLWAYLNTDWLDNQRRYKDAKSKCY